MHGAGKIKKRRANALISLLSSILQQWSIYIIHSKRQNICDFLFIGDTEMEHLLQHNGKRKDKWKSWYKMRYKSILPCWHLPAET